MVELGLNRDTMPLTTERDGEISVRLSPRAFIAILLVFAGASGGTGVITSFLSKGAEQSEQRLSNLEQAVKQIGQKLDQLNDKK